MDIKRKALDPFQTPLNTRTELPNVDIDADVDGVEHAGSESETEQVGRVPEQGQTAKLRELGEPIALEARGISRRAKPASSSSSSGSSLALVKGRGKPIGLATRKDPADLFFPKHGLSTITPRPSPPRDLDDHDDDHEDDDMEDDDNQHDHPDSDYNYRTHLSLDPRSTPWGPGALTSDTARSYGSPADMELRTPGLDSSVLPVRRFGGRAGIVGRRGRDENEEDEEELALDTELDRGKKGVKDWRTIPPKGLETPAPAPGSRVSKDLSAVFPFALSTPQNTSARRVSIKEEKKEKEAQLETPVQSQPSLPFGARSEPPRERQGKGRTIDSPGLPIMGPLSTPIAAVGSHEVGSSSNPMSTGMSMSTGKKRRRTSPEELRLLEEAYERNQLPTSEERGRLAGSTGMSTRAVQIWFQNKRQTEKRKANQKVFPTLMLVPLRPGSGSEPSSEAPSDETPSFLLPLPAGQQLAGSRSPTMPGYQFVPAGSSGVGQSAVSKGKRPVLPGDQEEDTFFTGKTASRTTALGKGKALDEPDDEERDLGVETEGELDQGDREVDEIDEGDEGIVRGRSRDAVLPTSDVRSSSPALLRSSSPVVMLKERQQLKRRGSSADDKSAKEQDGQREKLMLFPSSSSIEVELSEDVVVATPTQMSARSDGSRRDSPAASLATPRSQDSSKSNALKRSVSERIPGSLKRQIIGIADISAGDQLDASPSAPFSGRKFVVTQSVPSLPVRRQGTFAKPVSPLGKRKFSRFGNAYLPVRSDLPTPGKSFGRSQSGILDEMCSRKELPFMPSSARKELPGTPSSVALNDEPEDHVKVESEIMLSQSKISLSMDNSLLDLLPSDPPSMGLIDLDSDAENAPFEGDTDVEETPKKRTKTQDGSHGPGVRHFASLDYFAGSPSKRKGLLGDESRRLSGMGTARRRLFEAHLQQQAQQRASLRGKKQTVSSKKIKRKTPAGTGLKRSGSSSSASIALATIEATPTRKPLASSHSLPDLALVTSDKVNLTPGPGPGRRVRAVSKDGKAEQQTDEEAARLLLGLFGGRS